MTDTIKLRGEAETLDVRLDRVVQFDEKSREFPITAVLPRTALNAPRTKTWGCRVWNDQGREGACVGFAWSHELSAEPNVILASPVTALKIYKRAQFLDPWPGEDYEGTSVLAGAKATQELTSKGKQIMPEYRWAFGVDDLIVTLGYHGPAVIGVNWYEGMFDADRTGFIRVTGQLSGGHAILVRGITIVWKTGVKTRTLADIDRDKSYFTLRNSWGQDWGVKGDCYVTVNDMDRLLKEDGECCIPVVRIAR